MGLKNVFLVPSWNLIDTGNYEFFIDKKAYQNPCKAQVVYFVSNSSNATTQELQYCYNYLPNCNRSILDNNLCPVSRTAVLNNYFDSTLQINDYVKSCLELKKNINNHQVECYHGGLGEYLNSLINTTSIVILYKFNKPNTEIIPIDRMLYQGKIIIMIRSQGNFFSFFILYSL